MRMTTLVCVAAAVVACGTGKRHEPPPGGGDAGATGGITFLQAVGGAMFANPDAYPTIPIHVVVAATSGEIASVIVGVDGTAAAAVPGSGAGEWIAQLPIGALADGTHTVVATAPGASGTATLVIGRAGMQWTNINVDQNAGTPRLYRVGARLFLTWTDISSGTRTAWKQELDGAGTRIGDKVALVGGPALGDVLYARTALGASTIGVLYQQRGGPYTNFFTIVAPDGTQVLAPIALDPMGRYGSYGGEITWQAGAYDLVWRTNDGMGNSDVRWLHVDEATGTVMGPTIVASPGNDNPDGGFNPITDVTIGDRAGATVVAFSRFEHDATLATDVLKCQLATVTPTGVAISVVASGPGFSWDDDCRILDDGTSLVAVRSGKDLASTASDPPDQLFGARVPLATDRGGGALMVDAPQSREEPVIVTTSAAPVIAWSDARSYAVNMQTGQVQLYAAPLGVDLSVGTNVLFAHTHFIEGTAEIHGAPAGSNALLVWIDERHGGTIVNPRPEVYLETVWQ